MTAVWLSAVSSCRRALSELNSIFVAESSQGVLLDVAIQGPDPAVTPRNSVNNDLQVSKYDHTLQKPAKGTVLAYWQVEEGLKAADSMKESPQEGELAGELIHERQHPRRRVDPTGSHAEADAEADEPSVAPEVSVVLFGCVAQVTCSLPR